MVATRRYRHRESVEQRPLIGGMGVKLGRATGGGRTVRIAFAA
jgi:hypothetical protein